MNYSKRVGLLRRRMGGLGVTGLLVTHLPDVRYLCGFTGSNAALAVTRRGCRLFTDGRYTVQAAEEVAGSPARVEIVPSGAAVAAVQWLAVQVTAGFSGAKAPVSSLRAMRGLKPPPPSDEMRARSDEMRAPSGEMRGSSGGILGSSDDMRGSSGEMRAHSSKMRARSDDMRGSSGEMRARSDEMRGSSDYGRSSRDTRQIVSESADARVPAVGFDSAHTSVAEWIRLKAALPAGLRRKLLVAVSAPVEPLRWLKDEDELAVMTEAAALGDRLFEHLLGFIRPGLTETAVAAELEYQARVRGAEGMSFESIVAAGARSALPHGRASGAKVPRRGFLTLDFGVILKGYCSDMTRTVCLGKPTGRERQVYETVLAAQEAAVAAVAAGVECGVVDEAARGVLRAAGMAEAFSHSTGHGVGIEIHEGPRIGAGQKEKLAAGMVITIEPGVYFAGEFGLRIEDMVAVTRTGGTVLTRSPKALIEL